MITVIETWHLLPRYAHRALEIMQRMDEIVGPYAHTNSGWIDHARFYQAAADPSIVLMLYYWHDCHSHSIVTNREKTTLAEFITHFCSQDRTIAYFDELPVDVDLAQRPPVAVQHVNSKHHL